MKKLVVLLVVVVLLVMTAVQGGGLSVIRIYPPEHYNTRFAYWLIDYDQEGLMVLVTIGGEPGGYTEEYPVPRFHALDDGELRTFAPAPGSVALPGHMETFRFRIKGFRDRESDELRWFILEPYLSHFWVQYEIEFCFDTFQYFVSEAEPASACRRIGTVILTDDLLEQLLTDPEFEAPHCWDYFHDREPREPRPFEPFSAWQQFWRSWHDLCWMCGIPYYTIHVAIGLTVINIVAIALFIIIRRRRKRNATES